MSQRHLNLLLYSVVLASRLVAFALAGVALLGFSAVSLAHCVGAVLLSMPLDWGAGVLVGRCWRRFARVAKDARNEALDALADAGLTEHREDEVRARLERWLADSGWTRYGHGWMPPWSKTPHPGYQGEVYPFGCALVCALDIQLAIKDASG
jgi:hypothetical protein